MNRYQILKGEEPPTKDQLNLKHAEEKLTNLTEAYKTLKENTSQCKGCWYFVLNKCIIHLDRISCKKILSYADVEK